MYLFKTIIMSLEAISLGVLDAVPSGVLCLGFVLFIVLLAQGGLSVFNVWYEHKNLPPNNEVAGIMFGAISLIYSLVLAFVIVAVWSDYDELNKTIKTETDKINGILSHSSALPDSIRQPLDTALFNYCNQVIDKEWKMESSRQADRPSAIPNIRQILLTQEPQNKIEESIFSVIDEDLSDISELRRNRLGHNHSQIPDLVWLILEAGSIMLIIFSYFFSVPSLKLKRIYLSFLASCIAMCMFLVYTLDHPFNGNMQVSHQPYTDILSTLKQYYAFSHP